MRRWTWSALDQVVACRLFGAKPLPEQMLTDCQLDPWEHTSVKFESKYKIFFREDAFENVVCEMAITLQWRHNGRDGVSNYQPLDCLLNRLFRRRSKKHQSSASLVFVWGIHRWPVNSPHKGPVTRKMLPFDDVIMILYRGEMSQTVSERLMFPHSIYTGCEMFNDGSCYS